MNPIRTSLRQRPFVTRSGNLISKRRDDLLSTRRGAMAIAFALMTVPIFLTIGGAVDYSRSVHFRAELQDIADSAATAAATVYDGSQAGGTSATNMANAYLAAGESRLPQYSSLTATITPSVVGTGEQVVVSVTATMNTTFLGILQPSISFTAASTALNPFPYGHINPGFGGTNGFSASAADTNTIYWYNVPSDGSIPPDSALTVLWSNHSGIAPAAPPPIPLTPNQAIGFAMRNTTGNYGTHKVGGVNVYYTNQYGSTYGHTQTMYSHLANPSDSTMGYNTLNNPTNVNGVNGTVAATGVSAASGAQGNDCTLQMVVVNADGTAAAPAAGSCSTSAWTYAAPTCKQLNGKAVVFYWNDMGGGTDDKDYNDAVFTYFCGGNGTTAGGAATGPTSVVLTQ